jgi:protein-disulfide isomerase/uncharacterized membrane protein
VAKKNDRKKAQSKVVTRPVRGWRIAFLVLCTVGTCFSADLLRLHANVHTNPDYHSYCAMSERVNCDTVALSDYSVFLSLPVSMWGLLGYLFMGSLAVWGLRGHPRSPSWPLGFAFGLALCCALLGIALFLISHLIVESVCLVCGGTYLVNIGLAFVAFMALRRGGWAVSDALSRDLRAVSAGPGPFALLLIVFCGVLIAAWLLVPPYWRVEAATGPGGLPVGTTAGGHPWIGATEPVLLITEYSDYQCPHCQRGHDEVRKLIEAHPDRVRVVHRQYPLDQQCNNAIPRPFHLYACRYARFSHCAQEQGRFWEANDYLFANGRRRFPVSPEELAANVGLDIDELRACASGEAVAQAIQADLESGRELGIRGTPTYVVRGETYPGRIPPEIIEAALRAPQQSAAE